MDKKKLLALLVFLIMGFFMATFANPTEQLQPVNNTPAAKETNDKTNDKAKDDSTSKQDTTDNTNKTTKKNNTAQEKTKATIGNETDGIGNVEKEVYVVRFLDYQGSVLKAQNVYEGDDATDEDITVTDYTSANVTYTFSKWDKSFTNITKNLDVTAKYDVKMIIGTVYVNDVKTDITVEIVVNNDTKNKKDINLTEKNINNYLKDPTALPTAEAGRELTIDKLKFDDEVGYIININESLIDYNVTATNGALVNGETSTAAHYEDIITLSHENKEDKGYKFDHYLVKENGVEKEITDETIKVGTNDIEVKAIYTPIVYTITYQSKYTDVAFNNNNPKTYTVEDEFTLLNPTKTGYKFLGWNIKGNTTATVNKGTTGNLVFNAIFSPKKDIKYTIIKYFEKLEYKNNKKYTQAKPKYYYDGVADEEKEFSFAKNGVNGFTLQDQYTKFTKHINADGSTVIEIYYDRNVYSVTYHMHDGDKIDYVKFQGTSKAPTNVEGYKENGVTYVFNGFNGVPENGEVTNVSSNLEFDAKYEIKKIEADILLYENGEYTNIGSVKMHKSYEKVRNIVIANEDVDNLPIKYAHTLDYTKDDDYDYTNQKVIYTKDKGYSVIVTRSKKQFTVTALDNVYVDNEKSVTKELGTTVTLTHNDIPGKNFIKYVVVDGNNEEDLDGDTYTIEKKNVSIKAVYEDIIYTVTFKDHDGKTIATRETTYGEGVTAPNYNESYVAGDYTYTANGWDKSFDNITESIEVNATYEITAIDAKVVLENGTVIGTANIIADKTTRDIVATNEDAELNISYAININYTKEEDYTYKNKKVNYTANEGFKVVVKKVQNTHTATALENVYFDANKTTKSATGHAGETVTLYHDDIAGKQFEGYYRKRGDSEVLINGNEYTFEKFSVKIFAKYSDIEYTVTFKDHDGNQIGDIQKTTYGKGVTAPTYSGTYTLGDYTYTANGWDKSFDNITDSIVVNATYEITDIKAKVVLEDGTVIGTAKIVANETTRGIIAANANRELNISYANNINYTEKEDYTYTNLKVVYTANKGFTVVVSEVQNTYTVTAGKNVTVDETTSVTKHAGETVTLSYAELTGKTFKKYTETDGNTTTDITGNTYTVRRANVTINAVYEDAIYTVTFQDHTGKVVGTAQTTYGNAIREEDIPNTVASYAEGGYSYVFNNKWLDEINNKTYTSFTNITDDLTVIAVYDKSVINYNISYYLDDGKLPEGKTNPTTYNVETEDFTLVEPELEGYDFVGWNQEGNKPVTITKGSAKDNGSLEFTAIYEPHQDTPYTINIFMEKENTDHEYTKTSISKTGETDDEIAIDINKVLSDNNIDVTGFEMDEDISVASIVIAGNGKGHADIYFNRIRHTVTYKVNDEVVHTTTVAYGNTIPTYSYTNYDSKEYQVSDWTTTSVITNSIMPNENVVYTATKTKRSYTVTWAIKEENGRIITLDTDSVEYGSTASYSGATPTYSKEVAGYTYNYVFMGWNNDPANTTITGETTFLANLVTLSAEAKDGMQLQYTQYDETADVKDNIDVVIKDTTGNIKKIFNDDEYTTDFTTNKTVGSHTLEVKATYNNVDFTNTRLRYEIIEETAFVSKFELKLNVSKTYEYTKDKAHYNFFGVLKGCTRNCDKEPNVDSETLDHNFLEIVEHYNQVIKVQKVTVNYKDGHNEDLEIGESVRYSHYSDDGFYNPVYLAQRNGYNIDNTYVGTSGTIRRNNYYPANSYYKNGNNQYVLANNKKCESRSGCTYYYFTLNTESYNNNYYYFRKVNDYYVLYTPSGYIDVDKDGDENAISTVTVVYHRALNVVDHEDEGTYKITFRYLGGEDFKVIKEEKIG